MELNRLFDAIENAKTSANCPSAFGEPQVIGDKTIIPVAQVTYGFGLGYGSGTGSAQTEDGVSPAGETAPGDKGEGGGGGGGAQVKPLGAIVVTPECVYVEQTVDATKVSLAGILMAAWSVYQVAKTVRAVLGRE